MKPQQQQQQQQRGFQLDSAIACQQQARLNEITCHTVISVPAVDSQEQPECSQLGDNSNSQPPKQQEEVQGAHEARQEVQFADLPQAWFRLLLRQYLTPEERLAMFCTCTTLAVTVANASTALLLTLWLDGRQSSAGHATALQLAANCPDIHLLVLGGNETQLAGVLPNVAAVWPCITQLKLNSALLSSCFMSSLQLQQLAHLHTIELDSASKVWRHSSYVAASALRQALPCGGLPLLSHVRCHRGVDGTDAFEVLEQLGPVLGHQVTQLTLDQDHWPALTALSKWPALTRLQLAASPSHRGPAYTEGDTSEAMKQLFKQGLTDVSIPAVLLEVAYDIESHTPCALEQLELLGTEVFTAVLARLPLHGVQRLIMPGRLDPDLELKGTDVVSNLHKCSTVRVVPVAFDTLVDYVCVSSIPSGTPTLEVQCDAHLTQWLTQASQNFHGALVVRDLFVAPQHLDAAHLRVLQQLPNGFHTLMLALGTIAEGCSWSQFIASLPNQVHTLVLWHCRINIEDLQDMLDQPPPSGLQRLALN